MGKKQLWWVIAGLIGFNIFTLLFFLGRPLSGADDEAVATIGNESITREDWLQEIEASHGKDILSALVDEKVVEQLAGKYNIEIPKEEIDRELLMIKTIYRTYDGQTADDKQLRRQVKHQLALEELLTKDVVVKEEDLKAFYDQNSGSFNIPPSYHVSQIVVKTKEAANETIKELEQGSSFAALAMERSIDEFSANKGGDLGFVSEADGRLDRSMIEHVQNLKVATWSKPVKSAEGYSILFVHEQIPGKKYSYDEVKSEIRRQLALEQMDMPASAKPFWDEADVDWFYGDTEN
ncbi:peptidyl-prolyl cis-trans isomerase [Bacillus canaveralius]|uniref:peptidyl-prolyl cis-trans isomerase n=1 Tax=Bacillus canaveralius TaxID=1403243 RepID=UPI000F766566|nr:peptidyl-prolyl cis-trans isomerase [Bacillus canaveralius]RSK56882.1 peptidylprolyl isomerase [Bacillus canaveralius]